MTTRGGEVKSLYIVDATDNAATNAKWTSTTVQSYTVPAAKRWYLFGGTVTRDTATGTATLVVSLFDPSDNLVLNMDTAANGTGTDSYPDATYTGDLNFPLPMDPGWYVKITIGEAQGAAAAATCHVLQLG